MAIVGIGIGTCTLGRRQVDKDGNLVKETKASWEPDPSGGSVAIWPIDPETNEASGPARDFMAQYPKKNISLVDAWPGSEHWFVYRGKIHSRWIDGHKKTNGADKGGNHDE